MEKAMDKIKIQDLIDFVVTGARKIIEEHGDELAPVFFVVIGREMHIIHAPFGHEAEKDVTFQIMRRYLQDKQADAYVFVTEAWSKSVDQKAGETWDGTPPSQCADRQEILLVDGWTREGEHGAAVLPIKRDGEKRTLGEPEEKPMGTAEGATMAGRGACLFQVEKPVLHPQDQMAGRA